MQTINEIAEKLGCEETDDSWILIDEQNRCGVDKKEPNVAEVILFAAWIKAQMVKRDWDIGPAWDTRSNGPSIMWFHEFDGISAEYPYNATDPICEAIAIIKACKEALDG